MDGALWRWRFISEKGRELYSPPSRFASDFEAAADAKLKRASFTSLQQEVDQASCARWWAASLSSIACE